MGMTDHQYHQPTHRWSAGLWILLSSVCPQSSKSSRVCGGSLWGEEGGGEVTSLHREDPLDSRSSHLSRLQQQRKEGVQFNMKNESHHNITLKKKVKEHIRRVTCLLMLKDYFNSWDGKHTHSSTGNLSSLSFAHWKAIIEVHDVCPERDLSVLSLHGFKSCAVSQFHTTHCVQSCILIFLYNLFARSQYNNSENEFCTNRKLYYACVIRLWSNYDLIMAPPIKM